jgi:response regulator NasT
MRVLIADDEALHNLALTSQLETLGHQVVATATNGREAVDLADETDPDLAFLDIRMPTMTGPEAALEIARNHPIPMIILSAYSDARTVEQAIRAPIFHYLVKPVDPDDLAPAIAVARARFGEWLEARRDRDLLENRLQERKIIERAKGLLMETRGISEREAYRFLQKTSQDKNTPMVDLARKILLAAPLLNKE